MPLSSQGQLAVDPAAMACNDSSLARVQAVLMHKESAQGLPTGEIVDAVPGLISDSDLLLTGASLHVAGTLLRCHPSTAGSVSQKLLPPAVDLAQSPLLQVSRLVLMLRVLLRLGPSATCDSHCRTSL